MTAVQIRPQRVSDARKFLEILLHPKFIYFPAKPKSVEQEKEFLRLNAEKRRKRVEFNFSVIMGGRLVGGIGIKVDQQRRYIGEIGYFIDHSCWGKGLATAAVRLAERYAFSQLKLKRLEIVTHIRNIASQKVAEKCRYRKEGIQRGKILHNGKYVDAVLFAKTR
ncbi:MAG: GNAT family N-acetyltransferase [Deltaproteobacteria bacterium]|nr:GNAT family N-acetyltransferase [Deltaproteobacteria bacterium]